MTSIMKTCPRWGLVLALVGLCSACGADAGDDGAAERMPEAAVEDRAGEPGAAELEPLGALAPPSDIVAADGRRDEAGAVSLTPELEANARHLRRMDLRQLKDAIRTVTGGVYWRDNSGRDMFDVLGPTLGVPNYLDITNEDLESSLVFQKFLGDGVRQVCDETINNDLDMAPADRVLIRFVEPEVSWEEASPQERDAFDQNLRYMKLRMTGHSLSPQSEELDRLRWLQRSVTHATGEPARGWRAVCVGLMSSPEFFMY